MRFTSQQYATRVWPIKGSSYIVWELLSRIKKDKSDWVILEAKFFRKILEQWRNRNICCRKRKVSIQWKKNCWRKSETNVDFWKISSKFLKRNKRSKTNKQTTAAEQKKDDKDTNIKLKKFVNFKFKKLSMFSLQLLKEKQTFATQSLYLWNVCIFALLNVIQKENAYNVHIIGTLPLLFLYTIAFCWLQQNHLSSSWKVFYNLILIGKYFQFAL